MPPASSLPDKSGRTVQPRVIKGRRVERGR